MKKCPFCGKELHEKATNCFHCKSMLDSDTNLAKTLFLSENEKIELSLAENPRIQYNSSAFGGIWSIFQISKNQRRKKAVKLRTKMRMKELNLNWLKDYKEYRKIKKEEYDSFDKRVK